MSSVKWGEEPWFLKTVEGTKTLRAGVSPSVFPAGHRGGSGDRRLVAPDSGIFSTGTLGEGWGRSERAYLPMSFGWDPKKITAPQGAQLWGGPSRTSWENFHFHPKSPLSPPHPSFLCVTTVRPQPRRRQPPRNPRGKGNRVERSQVPSKTSCCHLTTLPWACPVCRDRRGTKRSCVQSTLCSCGRRPAGSSCHLAA